MRVCVCVWPEDNLLVRDPLSGTVMLPLKCRESVKYKCVCVCVCVCVCAVVVSLLLWKTEE